MTLTNLKYTENVINECLMQKKMDKNNYKKLCMLFRLTILILDLEFPEITVF